jgi:hypothetical protein
MSSRIIINLNRMSPEQKDMVWKCLVTRDGKALLELGKEIFHQEWIAKAESSTSVQLEIETTTAHYPVLWVVALADGRMGREAQVINVLKALANLAPPTAGAISDFYTDNMEWALG